MPFCEIPTTSLPHLGLFGFDVLHETAEAIFVHCPKDGGHILVAVDKVSPALWFDDATDAIQLGATGIVVLPPTSK